MTIFRFRSDTHQWFHNSVTKSSTTLPIELIKKSADLQCKMKSPPLKRERKKTHKTCRICATQNLNTLLDWWVSTPAQDIRICCVSFQILTEARKEKRTQNSKNAQSHSDVHANTPDIRAFAKSKGINTVFDVKRWLHQPNAGTRFREKKDQCETLQSRSVNGLMSFDVVHLIIIEQRCSSCFPTFAGLESRIECAHSNFLELKRFQYRTSWISRLGQAVCQHCRSVDPNEYEYWQQRIVLWCFLLLRLCEGFVIEAVLIHLSSKHRRYFETLWVIIFPFVCASIGSEKRCISDQASRVN